MHAVQVEACLDDAMPWGSYGNKPYPKNLINGAIVMY